MTREALTWNIHWQTTAFAALLLPCLLTLGVWQLHRAEEKRAVMAAFEQRRAAPAVDFATLVPEPPLYTRVKVTGSYDNAHSFLLDNRILQGKFGYEIITPFQPEGAAQVLLVNRGWIAGDPARLRQPSIEPIEGVVELNGHIYRDTSRFSFVATAVDNDAQHWPKLVQSSKTDDLQRLLGAGIFPYILRLDADTPGALRIEWRIAETGFGPERHTAYAVTWFTMSITLIAAWALLSSNLWQVIKGNAR